MKHYATTFTAGLLVGCFVLDADTSGVSTRAAMLYAAIALGVGMYVGCTLCVYATIRYRERVSRHKALRTALSWPNTLATMLHHGVL